MKPLSLDLQNARTFDSLHYDFAEGVTAITGPNGAGKSTLASAVDVALFGAEGRSLADWLSRDKPEATLTILLTFEHDNDRFRIRRTYDGRGRGKSSVDFDQEIDDGRWMPLSRESTSATQDAIEEIVGLTRESFRASAFAPQEQAGIFCNAQPRERKAILAAVLGLQVWDGYRDRARAELRASEQSLAVVRAKIESAETELSERPVLAFQLDEAQENEQAARAALAESESQLAKARERLSKLREAAGLREAAERARDAAERSHASLSDRIAALDRQIAADEARLAERPGLKVLASALETLERESVSLAEQAVGYGTRRRLEAEHARLSAESRAACSLADDLLQKAAKVLAGTDETCDRCGQSLHAEAAQRAAESYSAEADQLSFRSNCIEEQELVSLNERISPLPASPADPTRMVDVHDLIRLGQDAQTRLAALDEVQEQVSAHERERDQMRAELPEREQDLSAARERLNQLGLHDPADLTRAELEVGRLDMAAREQRRRLDGVLSEIARLDERLARLHRLSHETATLSHRRESLQQEVELLSHLERACGPNGVPALILETSAIPQLEAEWNRLLRLLPTDSGDLFEVELHTQREKKSGSGAVDALDIVVFANGHSRPYSTYSGGEQMRIAIAQRRALSNLLAHRRGADCPLMILDEPNSLDDQGMSALAGVLQDLAAAENLTVLVVSHDPALRDAFEQTVEIEKVDGRSRIVRSMQDTVMVAEAMS